VLIGSRHRWPGLGGLAWSSGRLLDELEALCRIEGWRTERLAERADVDSAADLYALGAELGADPRPARRALHAWVHEHAERFARRA
jgi:uncharacterized protein